MKIQIKDFKLATSEETFDMPVVELGVKFTVAPEAGSHIANINYSAIKSVLIQLLNHTIAFDGAGNVQTAAEKSQDAANDEASRRPPEAL